MFGVRNEEGGGRHPQNVKPLVSDFWSSPPTLSTGLSRERTRFAPHPCSICQISLPPALYALHPSNQPLSLYLRVRNLDKLPLAAIQHVYYTSICYRTELIACYIYILLECCCWSPLVSRREDMAQIYIRSPGGC